MNFSPRTSFSGCFPHLKAASRSRKKGGDTHHVPKPIWNLGYAPPHCVGDAGWGAQRLFIRWSQTLGEVMGSRAAACLFFLTALLLGCNKQSQATGAPAFAQAGKPLFVGAAADLRLTPDSH